MTLTPAKRLLVFLTEVMLSDRNRVNSTDFHDLFGLGCSKTGVDISELKVICLERNKNVKNKMRK